MKGSLIKEIAKCFTAGAILVVIGYGAVKTIFVENIDPPTELPPLLVSKADGLTVRQLPNPEAYQLATVSEGQALYLRCREDSPLHFGPWVGVIDTRSERIGWVHGSYVSDAKGACPVASDVPSTTFLREVSLHAESWVNVRFGPSTSTLPVAKVPPSAPLWTDGRYAKMSDGYRWMPVLLESGVRGWVRADLLGLEDKASKTASLLPLGTPVYQKAQSPAEDIAPSASATLKGGADISVGVSYRPTGSTAEMQRTVAEGLSQGVAAVLLGQANYPMQVEHRSDGRTAVQVELYSNAYLDPARYTEVNYEQMAQSMLVGDSELANHVEELHGPEAATMMRAAFVIAGVSTGSGLHGGLAYERFANTTFVMSQDPEVRAQASVLIASGEKVSAVLTASVLEKAFEEREYLRWAGEELARETRAQAEVRVDALARSARTYLSEARERHGSLFGETMHAVSHRIDKMRHSAELQQPLSPVQDVEHLTQELKDRSVDAGAAISSWVQSVQREARRSERKSASREYIERNKETARQSLQKNFRKRREALMDVTDRVPTVSPPDSREMQRRAKEAQRKVEQRTRELSRKAERGASRVKKKLKSLVGGGG